MAALTKVEVPQVPPGQPIRVALYRNITEAGALIEKLTSGKFEFALIEARTILSKTHLCAAIFRAINDQANGRMKTRNVHSEVVLSLNINNNIAEAYRKFGISKETTSLLVVKIGATNEQDIEQQLEQAIQGERVEATDANIASNTDTELVRKVYKIGREPNNLGLRKDQKAPTGTAIAEDAGITALEATAIELIAMRGGT